MIKQLDNSKTQNYFELKEHILSGDFPWYYASSSTTVPYDNSEYMNTPFYSHSFIKRPEDQESKYPASYSSSTDWVAKVLLGILAYNQIKINSFLRINANCVEPRKKVVKSVPHNDHNYPHTNMLVYLTASGGDTIVEGERFSPKEDDVVIFQGEHYMETPKNDRRIILIATYI
jgi:hypothetical protein